GKEPRAQADGAGGCWSSGRNRRDLKDTQDVKIGVGRRLRKREGAFCFDVTINFEMHAIEKAFAGLPSRRGNIFLCERRQDGEEKQNWRESEGAGFHGRRSIVTVMVSFDPKIGAS